eukprot:1893163-Lingulodinium_polyedra.AAC.1
MLRIGEARRPGPFRFASANITSWGAAAKCIAKAGANLPCLQEARVQSREREVAGALARSR